MSKIPDHFRQIDILKFKDMDTMFMYNVDYDIDFGMMKNCMMSIRHLTFPSMMPIFRHCRISQSYALKVENYIRPE